MIDTSVRTNEPEIMDDFAMEGKRLENALAKIAIINRVLGGNKITVNCVRGLVKNAPKDKIFSIVDLGCGNGDMLREIAKLGRRLGVKLALKGIDANAHTIKHAAILSKDFEEISYECANFLAEGKEAKEYDIILMTLTLHHFSNEEIHQLLSQLKHQAKLGIIINDLHRSKTAYYLFKAMATVLRLNNMTKEDGLTSILRGFKRKELEALSRKLKFEQSSIKWKWAYRYQWVITNL